MTQFGSELALMLSGRKPLAVFYKYVGEAFDEYGGQDFSVHVRSGTFDRSWFYLKTNQGRVIRYTMIFTRINKWRADLYLALKKSDGGWDKEKEQFERALLGNELL